MNAQRSPEDLRDFAAAAITGFMVGRMPSFGHRTPLPTLIDAAVMRLDRVYGGTGDPTVLISLAPLICSG